MKKSISLLGLWLAPIFFAATGHAEIVIQSAPAKTNDSGIFVPSPGAGDSARTDVLEFLNGDSLHGTFLSVDPKKGARWQHPAVKQPIEVIIASLSKIKLDRGKNSNTNYSSRQTCNVRLTNNDELLGQLVGLDEEKLSLETWYGGTLNIPRKMVASIAAGQTNTSALYEGPTGLEGWTVSKGGGGRRAGTPAASAWKYSNGSFFSMTSGSIGRELKFPPAVNIEFDLAWRGYLQLAVSMFSDSLETYGGNSYMLQLNQGSVYLQRMSRSGDSSGFGSTEVPSLAQKNKTRVSIRANREQKTISLVIDGTLVKQWTERGDFAPGSGLVFYQQGAGFVRLSNIRISDWDGKFEDSSSAAAKNKEDLVKLANNDKISGSLKAIKDGKMSFNTAFATLDVPMERVAHIELSGERAERAPQNVGDVRALFVDRGSITFLLERWDEQQVIGTSPNFGQVKLNPAAFSVIQFNLDKQKTEPDSIDAGESGPSPYLIIE